MYLPSKPAQLEEEEAIQSDNFVMNGIDPMHMHALHSSTNHDHVSSILANPTGGSGGNTIQSDNFVMNGIDLMHMHALHSSTSHHHVSSVQASPAGGRGGYPIQYNPIFFS